MKEIYDKIILGYKTHNENLLEANIKNWMAADKPNPFDPNTEEYSLYFNGQAAYKRWVKKVINYRHSKVEMVEYIQRLAAMNLPNPYDNEEKVQAEKIHVLGVLPEKEPEKEPDRKKPITKKRPTEKKPSRSVAAPNK